MGDRKNKRRTIEFDTTQILRSKKTENPYFLIIDGTGIDEKIYVNKESLTIGREETCDYTLHSWMVSKEHLKVVKMNNEVFVMDLNSTNGTYVNGMKIPSMKLKRVEHGNIIVLGNIVLKFIESEDFETQLINKFYTLSVKDPLTGAYNKGYFYERGKIEIERALRYQRHFSLAMLDIDDFKKVNDTYGHPFGDEVLKKIAEIILKTIRKNDVLIRYGGEEFVILFPETKVESALIVCERVRIKIRKHKFIYDDKEVFVTVSIGISGFTSREKGLEEIVESADKKLYRAKSLGKNRVVF